MYLRSCYFLLSLFSEALLYRIPSNFSPPRRFPPRRRNWWQKFEHNFSITFATRRVSWRDELTYGGKRWGAIMKFRPPYLIERTRYKNIFVEEWRSPLKREKLLRLISYGEIFISTFHLLRNEKTNRWIAINVNYRI